MWSNFVLSFNTVFPLFAVMLLGALLNNKGYFSKITQDENNNLVFKILMPILIFKNIFYTDLNKSFDKDMLIFNLVIYVVQFLVAMLIMSLIEKERTKKGALIHCSFRPNSIIYGMAVLANLYGDNNLGTASVVLAFQVPLANVLAVYTLERYRGGRVNAKHIFGSILKNPIIIATIIAILAVVVNLEFPTFIDASIEKVATMSTPIALLFLGGSIEFAKVKNNKRNLIIGVVGKLIVLPAFVIVIAILLGFRGMDLAAIMAIFAAPTAIAAYPMAAAMESDADLSGQIVAFSTIFSCVTVFMWIFLLRQLMLI